MALFDGITFALAPSLPPDRHAVLAGLLAANGAAERAPRDATHIITDSDFDDLDGGWQDVRPDAVKVTEAWVERSLLLGKRQGPQYFSPDPAMLFSGIVATATDISPTDIEVLSAGITALGGQWRAGLTRDTTHLFALADTSAKYATALHYQPATRVRVLAPHWFDDSVRLGIRGLATAAYEWPSPRVLAPPNANFTSTSGGGGEGAGAARITSAKRALFRGAVQAQAGGSAGGSVARSDVWAGRRILLCADLELSEGRRSAVDAGIARAGGTPLHDDDDRHNPTSAPTSTDEFDVLVCRYRWGPLYVQAVRAKKLVGSLAWLFHVEATGALSAPAGQLLHYPVPRTPIPGFSAHEITVTNYTGEAREYLKRLIALMGATFTPSLTGKNTVVIAALDRDAEEEEVEDAMAGPAERMDVDSAPEDDGHDAAYAPDADGHLPASDADDVDQPMDVDDDDDDDASPSPAPRKTPARRNSAAARPLGKRRAPAEAAPSREAPARARSPVIELSDDDSDDGGGQAGARVERLPGKKAGPGPSTRAGKGKRVEHDGSDDGMDDGESVAPVKPSPKKKAGPSTRAGKAKRDVPVEHDDSDDGGEAGSPVKQTPKKKAGPSTRAGKAKRSSKKAAPANRGGRRALDPSDHEDTPAQSVSPAKGKASNRAAPSSRVGRQAPAKSSTARAPSLAPSDTEDSDEETLPRRLTAGPASRAARQSVPASVRKTARRSAANKATQKLHDVLMPDLLSFAKEMRKGSIRDPGPSDTGKAKTREKEVATKKRRSSARADDGELEEEENDARDAKKRRLSQAKGKGKATAPADDDAEEEAPGPSARRKKTVAQLGAKTAVKANECTYLIVNNIVRTEKFLCAMAVAPHIVTEKWATASAAAKKLLPPDKYRLHDAENERKYDFKLTDALARAKSHEGRLFAGMVFYVTNKVPVDKKLLKNVVAAHGGQVRTQNPTTRIFAGKEKHYVVSCPEDAPVWRPLAQAQHPIYTQELLLNAALTQSIRWDVPAHRVVR
ncbi:hypothetical protein FA95DRAFT_1503597 [Auriscalpium vulgare]|uniref:Uncharacterized protein n=1 Tax=Auriscalpium vulgare TaxID=40419 RepID=A0ACB8R8C8_9AGAM|nr:hypothetical protein FA95DRAFT_1503597 [Auriscalpium vulgare]